MGSTVVDQEQKYKEQLSAISNQKNSSMELLDTDDHEFFKPLIKAAGQLGTYMAECHVFGQLNGGLSESRIQKRGQF